MTGQKIMYATMSMQEKGQKEMIKQYKFEKKQIIVMYTNIFEIYSVKTLQMHHTHTLI